MRLTQQRLLRPRLAPGRAVAHVIEVGLASTDDAEILATAESEGRTIVTADTDLGALLARVGEDLEQGAIASVTPERISLRDLPISHT